jgi:hypothetical protein
MHGPTCIFWANLTPFSLEASAAVNASVPYRYFRAGNSGGGAAPVLTGQDPGLFYGELLWAEEATPFRAASTPPPAASAASSAAGGAGTDQEVGGMRVQLSYGPEGRRIVDMAHNAILDTLATFVKDFPNYGDGSAYWSINRNDNGSLPLTTFALDRALLEWGLVAAAAEKVGFYLSTWVDSDGFIDQSVGASGNSGWMYGCPLGFPDGLSDFGQLLELWVQVAKAKQQQQRTAQTGAAAASSASAARGDQWVEAGK